MGEDFMGIPRGTIRTTLLVETYPAIFQTEEIIFALRDYICGLNCGRWDYLFSMIKSNMDISIPDRSLLTMDKPFLSAYIERIVQSCHRRGIHAMGGMSAFIPTGRNDEEIVNKIIKDKELEISLGCDGAWVAHPGLIETVQNLFNNRLEGRDNQYNIVPERKIEDYEYLTIPDEMLQVECFTHEEVLKNINVSLQYLAGWLYGNGAVALNGLMEDMATCEISLYQLKQWIEQNRLIDYEIANYNFDIDKCCFYLRKERLELEKGENLQVPYAKEYLENAEKIIVEYLLSDNAQFLPDVAYGYLNKK
jgi:malate synthase